MVIKGHNMRPSFRFHSIKIPAPMDFMVSLPEENLTVGFMICPEVKNSHLLVIRTQTINGYVT